MLDEDSYSQLGVPPKLQLKKSYELTEYWKLKNSIKFYLYRTYYKVKTRR